MASSTNVLFAAFDAAGARLTGLTPVWVQAVNNQAPIAGPAISERTAGSGIYHYTPTPGVDLGGLIDLGATAVPRYLVFQPRGCFLLAAYDVAGAPLAGLTPAFEVFYEADTGNVYAALTIDEIANGLYAVPFPFFIDQHFAGVIDFGATAEPRRVSYDGRYEDRAEGDVTPPVVAYSPAAGATVAQTAALQVDVTETGVLGRIIIHVEFPAGTGIAEVVHDGDEFKGLYGELSTREIIAEGWRYTVRRTGGWPSNPTLRVFPFDTEGNEPA